MNLTPASSSDLPSAPILTRVSLSATRLMQTAIFTVGARGSGLGARGPGGRKGNLAAQVPKLPQHPRTPSPELAERTDPRDLLPQDQRVNVVRPLVGVHRLEVRQVPHRLILGQDAVGAEQSPGLAGDFGRHVHVVALGQ